MSMATSRTAEDLARAYEESDWLDVLEVYCEACCCHCLCEEGEQAHFSRGHLLKKAHHVRVDHDATTAGGHSTKPALSIDRCSERLFARRSF